MGISLKFVIGAVVLAFCGGYWGNQLAAIGVVVLPRVLAFCGNFWGNQRVDPADAYTEVISSARDWVDGLKSTTGGGSIMAYNTFSKTASHIKEHTRNVQKHRNSMKIFREFGWDEIIEEANDLSDDFTRLNDELYEIVLREEITMHENLQELPLVLKQVKHGQAMRAKARIERMIKTEERTVKMYSDVVKSVQRTTVQVEKFQVKVIDKQRVTSDAVREEDKARYSPLLVLSSYIIPPVGYIVHTLAQEQDKRADNVAAVNAAYGALGESLDIAIAEIKERKQRLQALRQYAKLLASALRDVGNDVIDVVALAESAVAVTIKGQQYDEPRTFQDLLGFLEDDVDRAMRHTRSTLKQYAAVTKSLLPPA